VVSDLTKGRGEVDDHREQAKNQDPPGPYPEMDLRKGEEEHKEEDKLDPGGGLSQEVRGSKGVTHPQEGVEALARGAQGRKPEPS